MMDKKREVVVEAEPGVISPDPTVDEELT